MAEKRKRIPPQVQLERWAKLICEDAPSEIVFNDFLKHVESLEAMVVDLTQHMEMEGMQEDLSTLALGYKSKNKRHY